MIDTATNPTELLLPPRNFLPHVTPRRTRPMPSHRSLQGDSPRCCQPLIRHRDVLDQSHFHSMCLHRDDLDQSHTSTATGTIPRFSLLLGWLNRSPPETLYLTLTTTFAYHSVSQSERTDNTRARSCQYSDHVRAMRWLLQLVDISCRLQAVCTSTTSSEVNAAENHIKNPPAHQGDASRDNTTDDDQPAKTSNRKRRNILPEILCKNEDIHHHAGMI